MQPADVNVLYQYSITGGGGSGITTTTGGGGGTSNNDICKLIRSRQHSSLSSTDENIEQQHQRQLNNKECYPLCN